MRLNTQEQGERITWSVKSWNRMNFVTATLAEREHDPKVISRRWTAFIKALQRYHAPNLQVIRVLQKHPGGHGWHIHALMDRFIPAKIMLNLAKDSGLGRINFQMVSGEDRDRSINYMVRYICRDMKKRWKDPALKGVRLLTASGSLRASKRWWVRLCDMTIIDTKEKARHLLQTMLELRYAGSCIFKTWRGRTIPVRMVDLLRITTAEDILAWHKECDARLADWLGE